jgi:hypothetical protein
MKIIITQFIILLTAILLNAQIYNKGKIVLENNAKININSALNNYSTGEIDNSGSINLKGDWINFSGQNVFNENKGTVYLSGQTQSVRENPTDFGYLELSNNSHAFLQTNISVENELFLKSGYIDLNHNTLFITNPEPNSIKISSGYILSTTYDNRLIWNTENKKTKYFIPFADDAGTQVPINFEIISLGSGQEEFNTYQTDDNNNPLPAAIPDLSYKGSDISNKTIDRFWYINPNGSKLKTTLYFSDDDINGNQIDKNNLNLIYFNGMIWEIDSTDNYNNNGSNGYTTIINKKGWYSLVSKNIVSTIEQNSISKLNLINIYPNPANNEILFILPEIIGDFNINILDLSGKIIFNNHYKKQNPLIKINISSFIDGIYFVAIQDENSNIYMGKFIKSF